MALPDRKSNLTFSALTDERLQLIQLLLDRGWTQNVDFFEPPPGKYEIPAREQHIYLLARAIELELTDMLQDFANKDDFKGE